MDRDDSREAQRQKPGSIPVGSPLDYVYLAALVALTLMGVAALCVLCGIIAFIISIPN